MSTEEDRRVGWKQRVRSGSVHEQKRQNARKVKGETEQPKNVVGADEGERQQGGAG